MDAIRQRQALQRSQTRRRGQPVTSMGRMAAHTGQEITFDDMLNSDHEFAPGIDKLTADSPGSVLADAKGMYPQPEPGRKTREYSVFRTYCRSMQTRPSSDKPRTITLRAP